MKEVQRKREREWRDTKYAGEEEKEGEDGKIDCIIRMEQGGRIRTLRDLEVQDQSINDSKAGSWRMPSPFPLYLFLAY